MKGYRGRGAFLVSALNSSDSKHLNSNYTFRIGTGNRSRPKAMVVPNKRVSSDPRSESTAMAVTPKDRRITGLPFIASIISEATLERRIVTRKGKNERRESE